MANTRTTAGIPLPQGFAEDPLTNFSRLFVKFLQVIFSSFEKGQYKWEPDDKLTDISITDQATINREVIERRPALIVSRGPASFSNVSLNQFAGPRVYYSDPTTVSKVVLNKNPQTGTKRFTDLISAVVDINCLSREGLEAQRLAWITGNSIRVFKAYLLKAGLHRVGEDVSFGAESPPGSIVSSAPNEIVMVTVSAPFFFQYSWSTSPLQKNLLNEITIGLKSIVDAPAPGATILNPPAINGKPIQYSQVLSLDSTVSVGGWKTPRPLKV